MRRRERRYDTRPETIGSMVQPRRTKANRQKPLSNSEMAAANPSRRVSPRSNPRGTDSAIPDQMRALRRSLLVDESRFEVDQGDIVTISCEFGSASSHEEPRPNPRDRREDDGY